MATSDYAWVKVSVDCLAERVDAVGEVLENFGAQSVAILLSGPDRRCVEALFDRNFDARATILHELNQFNDTDREYRVTLMTLVDRDWVRESQRLLKPVDVNHHFSIIAPWHDIKVDDRYTVIINPATAFGTGHHETTLLCARQLSRLNLNGRRMVDYGCGSGVLATAALRFGAECAWGVDIDPMALNNSRENATLNGVADQFLSCLPQELPNELQVDIVVANIFADALVELSDELTRLTRREGYLILSGVLLSQIEAVIAAYPSQFRFAVAHLGEWATLTGWRRE